jgi:hypothetical protein
VVLGRRDNNPLPYKKVSCEYIERTVAESRQGAVLSLGIIMDS